MTVWPCSKHLFTVLLYCLTIFYIFTTSFQWLCFMLEETCILLGPLDDFVALGPMKSYFISFWLRVTLHISLFYYFRIFALIKLQNLYHSYFNFLDLTFYYVVCHSMLSFYSLLSLNVKLFLVSDFCYVIAIYDSIVKFGDYEIYTTNITCIYLTKDWRYHLFYTCKWRLFLIMQ